MQHTAMPRIQIERLNYVNYDMVWKHMRHVYASIIDTSYLNLLWTVDRGGTKTWEHHMEKELHFEVIQSALHEYSYNGESIRLIAKHVRYKKGLTVSTLIREVWKQHEATNMLLKLNSLFVNCWCIHVKNC